MKKLFLLIATVVVVGQLQANEDPFYEQDPLFKMEGDKIQNALKNQNEYAVLCVSEQLPYTLNYYASENKVTSDMQGDPGRSLSDVTAYNVCSVCKEIDEKVEQESKKENREYKPEYKTKNVSIEKKTSTPENPYGLKKILSISCETEV